MLSPNRFRIGISILLFVSLQFYTFQIFSQDNYSPDRPGFSTGTSIMSPRRISLEFGYQFSFASINFTSNFHQLPLTNVRYGLSEKLEVNVFWSGIEYLSQTRDINITNSYGIGSKYNLVEDDVFNISLLGRIDLLGLDLQPLFACLWDYTISQRFNAFGNFQLVYNKIDNLFSHISVGLSYSLNDRICLSTEYFNKINQHPLTADHNWGGGIAYSLPNNFQLDINFGSGFNSESYRFIGFGLSKML